MSKFGAVIKIDSWKHYPNTCRWYFLDFISKNPIKTPGKIPNLYIYLVKLAYSASYQHMPLDIENNDRIKPALVLTFFDPKMTLKRSYTCPTSFEEMLRRYRKIELHWISWNSGHDFFRERRSLLHWEDLSCQCSWYGRKMASRSRRKHAQVGFRCWFVSQSETSILKTKKAMFVV